VQRVGVDHRHLLGEEGFRRQRQRLGGEGRVVGALLEHPRAGVEEGGRGLAGVLEEDRRHQPLPRLPAVERVVVLRHEVDQLGLGVGVVQDHRRGEAAKERRNWFCVQILEFEFLFKRTN